MLVINFIVNYRSKNYLMGTNIFGDHWCNSFKKYEMLKFCASNFGKLGIFWCLVGLSYRIVLWYIYIYACVISNPSQENITRFRQWIWWCSCLSLFPVKPLSKLRICFNCKTHGFERVDKTGFDSIQTISFLIRSSLP